MSFRELPNSKTWFEQVPEGSEDEDRVVQRGFRVQAKQED
jgi:hypothetical protein